MKVPDISKVEKIDRSSSLINRALHWFVHSKLFHEIPSSIDQLLYITSSVLLINYHLKGDGT